MQGAIPTGMGRLVQPCSHEQNHLIPARTNDKRRRRAEGLRLLYPLQHLPLKRAG